MAIENFGVNTLIIPMDTMYQNNGMFKAYGLVCELLSNDIPVKWAIQSGKSFGDTDFTASAQDVQTLAPIINHNYTGGPFIIDSAFEAAALPIITAWNALHDPDVTVHRATAPFTAYISSTMARAPIIAVPTYGGNMMIKYLNIAAISDRDILTPSEIQNGALFGYNKSECRRIYYDIFLSPSPASGIWNIQSRAEELDDYLRLGGYLHAVDASIVSIENEAGPFLTTSGMLVADTDKGDTSTFTVDIPDFRVNQGVSTGLPQGLPGGNLETWNHLTPGLTYNSETQILAHFMDDSKQYDFMIAGPYKNGSGAGRIVYEGGRDYDPEEPYKIKMENLYTRFVLDSVLFSVSKPLLDLQVIAPANIFAGVNNTITFGIVNTGGSTASNTGFSVTLAPGVSYNYDAAIPPTSIVGQTLTWSSAALDTVQPGTVLTFTADFTPSVPSVTKLADFSTSFDDEFNESYSLNNCLTAQVKQFQTADVTAVKTVDKDFAQAGDTLTYTVTITNNGPLSALNAVFTDQVPAGAIFVNNITINGVPAPGTDPSVGIPLGIISPPPYQGSTVVITWQVLAGDNTPIIDILNQGFVEYDFVDSVFGQFHNQVSTNVVMTQVEKGELTAIKSADKTAATVSDTITYTVVVTNTGTVSADNVIFTDLPPLGISFVAGSVTLDGTPQPGFNPIDGFSLGNIPVGGSVPVNFLVHVDFIPPQPEPPIEVNIAFIDFLYRVNPAGPDLPGSTVSSPALIQLLKPQLTVVKSADKTVVELGEIITYTINVTNTGNITANNVVITDPIPPGTIFVPGSVTKDGSGPVGYDPSAGIPIGNMAPNETITVTFQVTANSVPVPNPTANIAAATGLFKIETSEPPRQLSFNSTPVEVRIESVILDAVKSADQSTVKLGDILTYTIILTNSGTVTLENAIVTDPIPTGTSFVQNSLTINGVSLGQNPKDGVSVGSLLPGRVAVITFKVLIDFIPSSSKIFNSAAVGFEYTIGLDTRAGTKNTNTVVTYINANILIVITK
jgi:uncharacterized repeat protein (TIGR01451 family)